MQKYCVLYSMESFSPQMESLRYRGSGHTLLCHRRQDDPDPALRPCGLRRIRCCHGQNRYESRTQWPHLHNSGPRPTTLKLSELCSPIFVSLAFPSLSGCCPAQRPIEMGWVCSIFCEGRCDDRLEYFLDLPKGKLVLRFAETDIFRAKEILGDHSCIMGAVPSSLLVTGSVQEVDEYCRKLIEVCGKGGGFILRATTDSIEHHKPENIKAMVDSTKKYGWY